MIKDILLFGSGLVILFYGARWLVNGASNIAIYWGIRPIIVGLTIVSFGTSLPELVVSIIAALKGAKDIALGNIIGSNIANIGLVLGLSAIIRPLHIKNQTIKKDIPIMIAVSLLLYYLAGDLIIDFFDGIILFAGIILFVTYCVYNARTDKESSKETLEDIKHCLNHNHNLSVRYELVMTIIGIGGVILGADIMVRAASSIARAVGLSELFIGMTIVAVGTSLPELATSVAAAYLKKMEISVGNVIGSNIFNICMVIGMVSIVSPLHIERLVLQREMIIMLLFSLVIFPLMLPRRLLTRTNGVFLVIGYIVFILYCI